MSTELHSEYLACPECGSDLLQFLACPRHEVEVRADLMFWCVYCDKTLRYSLTARGTKVSAVWSDVTEDI